MSKRKVMSIIGLCLNVLLIIFLFLPYAEGYRTGSLSQWDFLKTAFCEELPMVLLIEFIIGTVLLILQICGVLKDTKLAMLPYGFVFTTTFSIFLMAMNKNVLSSFEFGFYFTLIFAIAGIVILGIGGLLSNENKPKYSGYAQPIGFDPQTGKPIFEAPKQIVGYDPQTGKPIYK